MEKPKPLIYRETGQPFDIVVEEVMSKVKEKVGIILNKLKERVENNEFGMVLGVDGSGRIPALLLGKAMQYKTEIGIRFVAGSRYVAEEDREQRISELADYFSSPLFTEGIDDRKVLVCDDVIVSGESIELICKALQRSKISYEVVALSLQRGLFSEYELQQTTGSAITSVDSEVPVNYNKSQMAGVKKSAEIFSEPLNKYVAPVNNIPGEINNDELKQKPEILKRTRELINQHAQELAEEMGWVSN